MTLAQLQDGYKTILSGKRLVTTTMSLKGFRWRRRRTEPVDAVSVQNPHRRRWLHRAVNKKTRGQGETLPSLAYRLHSTGSSSWRRRCC